MTTQIDASIGIKKETTYGTGVTVDQHYEFLTESLDYNLQITRGKGLRQGSRVPRASRSTVSRITVGGDISFEAYARGFSRIFEAAFGTGTATVISGAAYQHLFTLTTTAPDPLPSYTIQKGLPPVGGGAITTAYAQTFTGCQLNTLTLSCAADGAPLQIDTSWVGKDMTTATAYATPTYPSATNGAQWTFLHGAVTLGGSVTVPTTTALATGGTAVANVTGCSVTLNNNLDGDGFYFGGAGKRGRASVVQWTEDMITGSLSVEYTDNVVRDAYINQTALALVLTFQGTTAIAGANYPTIQVTIPNIRFNGTLPKANGGQVVSVEAPFTGEDGGVASSPIYLAYVTADTTI